MKDIPHKIYLQVGEDCPDDISFSELSEVTWCRHRVFNTDIEFALQPTRVLEQQLDITTNENLSKTNICH